MNLFEAIALLSVAIGAVAALVHGPEGRPLATLAWDVVVGAGTGYLAFVLVGLSLIVPLWIWQLVFPSAPRCRQGRCTQRKYRHLDPQSLAEPLRGLEARDERRWLPDDGHPADGVPAD